MVCIELIECVGLYSRFGKLVIHLFFINLKLRESEEYLINSVLTCIGVGLGGLVFVTTVSITTVGIATVGIATIGIATIGVTTVGVAAIGVAACGIIYIARAVAVTLVGIDKRAGAENRKT
ncbi:MAG: hypothetical protein J6V80_03305 [Clostridia bacterium]|nr:hypothetical protein [Clostridia bacterium]